MVYREHCLPPGIWVWVHGRPQENPLVLSFQGHPGIGQKHHVQVAAEDCVVCPSWEERAQGDLSMAPSLCQGLDIAVINLS